MAKVICPQCDADASDDSIIMHSGVNAKLEGFVHLASGAHLRIQLAPDEVRGHALRLLEAAEAAESDSAVARLLIGKIGVDRTIVVHQIIPELRNYREAKHQKE